MKRKIAGIVLGTMAIATAGMIMAPSANASGVTVYKDGDKFVEVGGRIQLQYHLSDPDGSTSTDGMFFRRLRPYIEGSIHKDWLGKFEWDMGGAGGGNKIAIKDAFMGYKDRGGVD